MMFWNISELINKMNIGSIAWPVDRRASINLYLGFLIKVIETLDVKVPSVGPEPLSAAKMYMIGQLPENEYRAFASIWWRYIDGEGEIRNFKNEDFLKARIAICLLSVTLDDVEILGEHLSWFFEVLELLGINLDIPINMMIDYFEFHE